MDDQGNGKTSGGEMTGDLMGQQWWHAHWKQGGSKTRLAWTGCRLKERQHLTKGGKHWHYVSHSYRCNSSLSFNSAAMNGEGARSAMYLGWKKGSAWQETECGPGLFKSRRLCSRRWGWLLVSGDQCVCQKCLIGGGTSLVLVLAAPRLVPTPSPPQFKTRRL